MGCGRKGKKRGGRRGLAAFVVLAVLALLVAPFAWASNHTWAREISNDATGGSVTFTDRDGGAVTFKATTVTVFSLGTSANTCYFWPYEDGETVAVAAVATDIPLAPGAALTVTYSKAAGNGFVGFGYICDTGHTATWHVTARR